MANLLAGRRTPPSSRRIIRATSSAAVTRGYPVKTDGGSPLKVADATDGDAVYGIATTGTEAADEIVYVIVEGPAVLSAKSSASWASHRRVVAAGSGEVDEGSTGDPYFATVISHDATDDTVEVYVHADAIQTVGRALVDRSDVVYPIGALTAGRPITLTTTGVETPLHSGTTANRPSTPFDGQTYYDTDIRELIIADALGNWVSTASHEVGFGYNRGSSVSQATMGWIWTTHSADTGIPWYVQHDAIVVGARFSLKSTSGGSTWTPFIRLNGSGSPSWTGTGRVSTTSWATYTETPNLVLSAGDRLYCPATQSGGAEPIQCSLILYYVYT